MEYRWKCRLISVALRLNTIPDIDGPESQGVFSGVEALFCGVKGEARNVLVDYCLCVLQNIFSLHSSHFMHITLTNTQTLKYLLFFKLKKLFAG